MQDWEEPTAIEAPTWDDEPSAQASVPAAADAWTSPPVVETIEVLPEPEETKEEPAPESQTRTSN